MLARPSYDLFFRFTTAANMNPLLTDEEFHKLLRKARASDSTTALDNVDTYSLLWRPTGELTGVAAGSWLAVFLNFASLVTAASRPVERLVRST